MNIELMFQNSFIELYESGEFLSSRGERRTFIISGVSGDLFHQYLGRDILITESLSTRFYVFISGHTSECKILGKVSAISHATKTRISIRTNKNNKGWAKQHEEFMDCVKTISNANYNLLSRFVFEKESTLTQMQKSSYIFSFLNQYKSKHRFGTSTKASFITGVFAYLKNVETRKKSILDKDFSKKIEKEVFMPIIHDCLQTLYGFYRKGKADKNGAIKELENIDAFKSAFKKNLYSIKSNKTLGYGKFVSNLFYSVSYSKLEWDVFFSIFAENFAYDFSLFIDSIKNNSYNGLQELMNNYEMSNQIVDQFFYMFKLVLESYDPSEILKSNVEKSMTHNKNDKSLTEEIMIEI